MAFRSSHIRECPADEELLRFVSGDLSTRRAEHVRRHIDGCGTCRDHLASANNAVLAFREYHDHDAATPQWRGFSHALRQEELSWDRQRRSRRRRHWSGVAAIAATFLVALVWQRQTEVVLNAETVISRAVEYEREQRSATPAVVTIRRATPEPGQAKHSDLRTAAIAAASHVASSEPLAPSSATARELAARLAAYGFDWAAPLSARHFQQWRSTTAGSSEHLQALGGGLLKVSTLAREGPVRGAELVVRNGNYEPVAQSWSFADGFQVEFTSLSDDGASATSPALPASPPTEPRAPAVPFSPTPNLEAAELTLRAALHSIGVSVGPDVTVGHGSNYLRLEGHVATSEALEEVTDYARRTGVRARVVLRKESPNSDYEPTSLALAKWLEQSLSNSALKENFVAGIATRRDDLGRAANVFANLANRYPPTVTASLRPESHIQLEELARAQLLALAAAYEALERQLAALIGTVSRPTMPGELPNDWRDRAKASAEHARQMSDALTLVLVTDFSTPHDLSQAARTQLRPILEQLAATIAGATVEQ